MNPPAFPPKRPPPNLLTAKVVWGALLGAQLMHTFVAFKLVGNTNGWNETHPDLGNLKNGLRIAALVTALMAYGIPKLIWNSARSKLSSSSPLSERITLFLPGYILRLALFEAITIYGIVFVLAAREGFLTFAPFLGLSVLGFSLNFPNETLVSKVFEDSSPEKI